MQFEKWFPVDLLNTIGHVQDIGTLMFTGDNNSHKIGVRLYKDAEPQTVTGAVVGYVIRGDGGTVAVTGSSSENKAWIILPEAAFAYQGRISITIQIVNGQEKTVVLAVSANVKIASTDTVVDPGTIIPSVSELIASIDAAVESIPADYTTLLGSVAHTFSTSTAYTAGQYVWYEGELYRFNAAHPAGAWIGTDAARYTATDELPLIQQELGTKADAADVADLKSAINGGQVTESVTASVPTSFNTSSNRCTLNLTDYTGKKAFISNKNLFPLYPSLTSNGVTLTPNADGSITLSGTATSAATFQLSGNVMPTIGNGTFTLSANNTVAIGDNSTYINPSINGSYGTVGCRLNSVNATETFTLGLTDRITAIRIRISSGVTLPDNYKLYIQLEEGTGKTAFVPHDGSIIDITEAETQATCFEGYNYVAVQRDVSGTVTYVTTKSTGGVINSVNDLKADVESLDTRVTALEQSEPTAKKFTGKKIVCFGDSITGNFPAPTDYPSMIAEITGATVYNVGFGGCCMCDNGQTRRLFTMCRLVDSIVAGDFSAQANSGVSITYAGTSINYVPERIATLESIDWSTIDYITIAYGTNDWNANYGLDNENNPLDTTTYIGAFRYSIEKLLAAYPNIKVFVLTPLWRFWDTNTGLPSEITSDYIDSNDYYKGTGYYLWNYGNALMEAAEKYQIPVFDLYHNCMMNRYNRLQYFNATDGTHPKLEGRELMAAMISARMEMAY